MERSECIMLMAAVICAGYTDKDVVPAVAKAIAIDKLVREQLTDRDEATI